MTSEKYSPTRHTIIAACALDANGVSPLTRIGLHSMRNQRVDSILHLTCLRKITPTPEAMARLSGMRTQKCKICPYAAPMHVIADIHLPHGKDFPHLNSVHSNHMSQLFHVPDMLASRPPCPEGLQAQPLLLPSQKSHFSDCKTASHVGQVPPRCNELQAFPPFSCEILASRQPIKQNKVSASEYTSLPRPHTCTL